MNMKIGGIDVNYFLMGENTGDEAVIMLHGWGANIELFRNIAEPISTKYPVAAPDMPGFGETPEPEAVWTVDDYTDFDIEFIRKTGFKKVILLDTIAIPEEKMLDKFVVLHTDDIFAKAIKCIYDDQPISLIFS